jgi:poly(hydroxyalkanoate) granule-associated protein
MTSSVRRVAAGMTQGGFEAAGREALALARTIYLAGLGAAATAGEAGVATFEALVEKGRRRRETPAQKLERKLTASGREAVELVESTGRAAYRQVAGLLDQLGVPTQNEIRALKARIDALRKRLA